MIQTFIAHRRHTERYRKIVRTLVRHGFAGVVGPMDIPSRVRSRLLFRDYVPEGSIAPETRPLQLRLALEELGPTFIKLGQILSSRADLLPPAYIAELERLQDQVPSESFETIRVTIERELGHTLAEAFLNVDPEPLATASIGQVHAARLHDGTDVVVKVQRTGVEETVAADLEILQDMARIGERRSGLLRRADLTSLVREFSFQIRGELDYRREARQANRLGMAFQDEPDVLIPRVFPERSTRRVLTLERIDGVRIDRYRSNDPAIPSGLAERLVTFYAHQVFDVGVFHADPHPGNFVVASGDKIGVYDFGMVGVVDDRLRERLLTLALSIADRNATRIVDEIAVMGALPAVWNRANLERDIDHLVNQYVGATLRDVPLAMVISDVMDLVLRHQLRLPSELALLAKTTSMLEALCRRLDPDIDVLAVVEPTIRKAMHQLYRPSYWGQRLRLQTLDAVLLASSLPSQTQRLLSRIDRNDLSFHVEVDELPQTMRELNNMVNRLAMSILVSAGWLGLTGLVLAVDPNVYHFPGALFLVAFGFMTILLALGLWNIWWSGKR